MDRVAIRSVEDDTDSTVARRHDTSPVPLEDRLASVTRSRLGDPAKNEQSESAGRSGMNVEKSSGDAPVREEIAIVCG